MKTYTLTHPAYGQPAGTTVALDDTDPLVAMNVEAGVLIPGEQDIKPGKMTCPICQEHTKNPAKLEDADSLAAHYETKHAGFVVPTYQEDEES